MDSLLIEKLERALIDPVDWEVSGVPGSILETAKKAIETDHLVAIGFDKALGWFAIVSEMEPSNRKD